ncbi:EAL domain-containing protein [Immundisolibacter sp.]|uniref:EAL domain-containing protein n=1 Tax=Immundisolibacter sp. TaxID=1934948 RepID=UPI0026111A36|nr:EAL domain-containing protein [Immundisolibacter sp.]MDD3651741.1 EAL domain-containing protein [Immundisolibacter sp.]
MRHTRLARLRSDTLVMLVCCLGALLLSLTIAGGISWLAVDRARGELLDQGRLLTERYAAQATLALLYGSPENAESATDGLLRFPNVVGVAVFNADGSTLLRRGLTDDVPVQITASWRPNDATRLLRDADTYWLFGAPVFVGTTDQDVTVFGEAVPPPQYQGQVAVAISKAALGEVTREILLSTAALSIVTAALFLPLLLAILRRISQPIQALARVMARTEAGDTTVRAELSGPADVQQMEHAFNSMMDRLRNRELELREARDAALDAARLKAQFAASVSHEIRTPLNGLLGMLQLLRESPLSGQQRERLDIAASCGKTLLALINDILDFSRLESGRIQIEHIPFDLPAKVREVVALFEPQARSKAVALQVDIAPDVPAGVAGDPMRIGQVLTNLIGNAIKFTPAGEVRLHIAVAERTVDRARLMFRVTDTGIGIADADLDRIFESFTQADSSTTRQFGGSGLGLTISRQLVRLMGGEIGVDSQPGVGSTFWFSLPLELAEAPALAPPAHVPAALPRRANPRVLVAEDNATNQLVAKGLLEASGCQVDLVGDGESAVTQSTAESYAAIFMDCNMPGMDGLEATRRIRVNEPAGQHVPIIAMTANTDAALLHECRSAGMDDMLPKPMQLTAIQHLLQKWAVLPGSGSDDAPAAPVPADGIIAPAVLTDLQDAIGDALPTVIRTFIDDAARYIGELRQAVRQRDTARIRDLAHTLKGSARNIGAERLAERVERIERLAGGANPDFPGLAEAAGELDALHGATRAALAHWSPGPPGSRSASQAQSHFTILLVEDDHSTRLALRGLLELDGYRVIEAGDGEEAMQLYPRIRPDLVLLDARLPRQDGFTTCRQILSQPLAQRTPVLMITSLADEISVERAFRAGAADYITKPINHGVLRRRVTRLLQAGASERHAHRLAYHDTLTGLPNRAGFRERLRQRLETADGNTCLAVAALDLDRFKVLNETLGHDLADEVLVQLGDRIRRQLRADDLLGRVGSDEFALAFETDGPDGADRLAGKILAAVAQPLHVRDQELVLGASMGVALYPSDDRDTDGLIRHAETALNQAKSTGGGRHHFWQSQMSVAVRRRLGMETDLRKALERSELLLFYQPQMNLGSGTVTGVEALIRWQHPQRGLVSPVDFIPLAEDTGLIGPIGEWVLREACRQNRLWQQRGLPPLRMAVNVSGAQLTAPEFVDTVARALEDTGHAPQRLELEITETTLMRDLDASAAVLARLRALGVRVAIDDFGTGYSSLGYLKHLPVQTVKIDRSFVVELPENAHDAAITNGIIDMGHNLGLEVVGEGVETAAQLRYLREHGCDLIQGYLLHAPTTPDNIEAWRTDNPHPNVAGLGVVKGPRGRR